MAKTKKALENKIQLSWKKMTKREQEISKTILDGDFDIYKKSITEFANELNCSVSTINRWSNKLGFDGYKSLQANIGVHSQHLDRYGESFSHIQNDIVYSISTTEHFLNYDDLEVCASKIQKTQSIIFYGEAFTSVIGEYFSNLFNKIGISSRVINVASEIALINNTENSVNIFISISGRNPNILKAYNKATFKSKIFAVDISTNNKSILKDVVNCSLIGDFYQTADINPHELPLVSKTTIDYILFKVFYAVYLKNEEEYKNLINKISKLKMRG